MSDTQTTRHSSRPIFDEYQIASLGILFKDHWCKVGTDESTYFEDGSSESPREGSTLEVDGYLSSPFGGGEDDGWDGFLVLEDEFGIVCKVPWQRIESIDLLGHRDVFGDAS